MEKIKLDLIPSGKMPSLHASQYDDGREHGIDLFENGVAYKLDGTETLTINERKGDDCICSLDIENTFAETNHIVFASTEQMCAVWGNNICELVIAKGEKTIGTLNFILEIEQSPTENGIESESEIKNLERQIEAITEEVIGDNYYTAEETDEAIATATEGKADTTYVDTKLDKKADKSTTYTKAQSDNKFATISTTYTKTQSDSRYPAKSDVYTKTQAEGRFPLKNDVYTKIQSDGRFALITNTYTKAQVDAKIAALPNPMIFKGTIGTEGTITTLPDASASNEGWTYKVITSGTYQSIVCKVGDVLTSNGSEWILIPAGDEDSDTWRALKVNGTEVLGSDISSGSADFVGSENIDVEFDSNGNKIGIKTKNIYTKSEVDNLVAEAIYDVLPSEVASGSVANFDTDLALPIKSLEVDVNAVQESGTPTPQSPKAISGVSAVSVVHCGSNFFDISTKTDNKALKWTDGDTFNDNKSIVSDYIEVKEGIRFASNYFAQWCCYDKDKNYLGNIVSGSLVTTSGNDVKTNTIPSGYGVHYLRLGYRSTTNNNEDMTGKTDIMLNIGNTAIPFEPFNGTTIVIDLGGTYYGGHFTQDKDGKREITVTHRYFAFNGNENWQTASNFFYLSAGTLDETPIQANAIGSNGLTINPMTNKQIRLYPNCGINSQYISMESSVADLQGYFSNGIGFVYKLATPFTIDLPDGEPIITFNGTNNIYADTGDCAVVFKESVNEYVEKKIASVQALALNT